MKAEYNPMACARVRTAIASAIKSAGQGPAHLAVNVADELSMHFGGPVRIKIGSCSWEVDAEKVAPEDRER